MQFLAGIVIDAMEEMVGIVERIAVVPHIVAVLQSVCRCVFRRVTVLVVEMASHQMQHHQVVDLRIHLIKEINQRLVVVHFSHFLLGPFCHIGSLGDERHRRVVAPDVSLVAVPADAIAGLMGDVDDGAGLVKGEVVVEVHLCQHP